MLRDPDLPVIASRRGAAAIGRLAVVLSLVLAAGAPAGSLAGEDEGVYLGPRFRWAEMPVLQRVLHDVVAIPANAPRWSAGDFGQLALWSGAVGALMFPLHDPADARLDRWIHRELDSRLPTVWTEWMQPTLWAGIAAGGLGTWGWAVAHGDQRVAQGCSLMGEALAVSQVYHLTLKFALGRDGPWDGDQSGDIKGPANALRVYPAGTPSGHAATLFSLATAGLSYFRPPVWVQVLGYGATTTLVAFHVIDHRHFLSDSLWGSAMGFYVGRWVVRHRASPLDADGRAIRAPRASVVPLAVPGGAGLALVVRD
ncbi:MULTISPECIES: phosphatase PAP2 family protein [Anaeromyxobacter]|uniref:phosphatase PAP2 family protein n=1 Tax=Anaeromyxobacter TaxID=161492 RepID=UPI001F596488|nr:MULTISPECIES: phosphatase PAP2 family protein [unclassified Anaeromyxobacter]